MSIHERNIQGEKHNADTINPLLFEGEHLIRQIEMNEETWFVGLDICRVLGIKDHHQALDRLDEDERGGYSVPTPMGDQSMIIVSEAGVYRLVFTSRKPVAERLKRWLAYEVIPAIRKTGSYSINGKALPEATETSDNENLKLRHVTECRQTFGTQAAAQLWFLLKLPVVPAMMQDPRQLTIFDYDAIKSQQP